MLPEPEKPRGQFPHVIFPLLEVHCTTISHPPLFISQGDISIIFKKINK